MTPPRRKKPTLEELQAEANEYARNYAATRDLHIPSGTKSELFNACMQAVMMALVEAWGAGYVRGTQR